MQYPFTVSDPELGKKLLRRLELELEPPLRFMEVCGTHTVALFQSGLRSLLPPGLIHVSGPGCPVCVTSSGEVAFALELARRDEVILASFGDMLRVPGPEGLSLKEARAEGARVEICYSPFEALALARKHRDKKVVFLGIGFETTAPAVAATIKEARRLDLENFSVFSCHKLVPPALEHLLKQGRTAVDAFLLPGHVSAVIGLEPYRFLSEAYQVPGVVAGFDPLDMLMALLMICGRKKEGGAEVQNQYKRVVKRQGNPKARAMMQEVFSVQDADWRGLGPIPASGLGLAGEYEAYDALKVFGQKPKVIPEPRGCSCGEVLQGLIRPDECPLFKTKCTPAAPVGPCMVSTEGSCAAYYKYMISA